MPSKKQKSYELSRNALKMLALIQVVRREKTAYEIAISFCVMTDLTMPEAYAAFDELKKKEVIRAEPAAHVVN